MTRDEILNMPAGREMDSLVAEKVMGRPKLELQDARCPYCGEEMHYTIERAWCMDCKEWRYSPYKEYSSDISAAWEVVEKLFERGWYCELII